MPNIKSAKKRVLVTDKKNGLNMDYDIKKDTTPQNTIEKIKKILEENNIETICNSSGQGQNYCSVRVRHPKFNIGTNGKGINELNAKASGYAEFMERLQNQFLFDFQGNFFVTESDEKLFDIDMDNISLSSTKEIRPIYVTDDEVLVASETDMMEEPNDISNGRLEIFREYIKEWNLTGLRSPH